MASNEGILCSHSYNFYAQRVDGDDKDTVQLEKHKAVTKSEMYRILRRFVSGQAAKRNPRSGGKWQTFTAKNSNKLINPLERSDTVSLQTATRQLVASDRLMHKMLATKTDIRYHKQQAGSHTT